ncbi:hypothetical protein IFVP5_C2230004 [Vibrio parahaemolyticus]
MSVTKVYDLNAYFTLALNIIKMQSDILLIGYFKGQYARLNDGFLLSEGNKV